MRKQGPRLSLALGGKPGAPRCQSLTITEGKRPRVTTHAGGRPSTEGSERRGSKLHTQQASVLGDGQVSSLLVVYTLSLEKVRI